MTMNYRLGALGFFVYGSGSDAIDGNFGIKVLHLQEQACSVVIKASLSFPMMDKVVLAVLLF